MIREQLLKGSFRGIEFDFLETSKSSGRKSVIHTFPNSDTVISEDLGREPISIGMRIIIGGTDTSGTAAFIASGLNVLGFVDTANNFTQNVYAQNYFTRRDAMEKALESKGHGILVHPTRGELTVQISGMYTMRESIAELGTTTFDVNFIVIDKKEFLPVNTAISSYVQGKSKEAKKEVEEKVDESLTARAKRAYDYVKDKTDAIVADIKEFAAPYVEVANDLNDLSEFALSIVSDINGVIQSGYGNIIGDLFDKVGLSITNPFDTYNYFTGLFNFGDNDVQPDPTTVDNAELVKNQDAIRTLVQSEALSFAVDAATNIEFTTDEELNEVANVIYAQYEKVFELPLIDSDTFAILQEQRVSFNKFVEEETLQVLKVTNVSVVNESLNTLAYKYYGNADNVSLLQNLNDFRNPSLINGEIKIAVGQ